MRVRANVSTLNKASSTVDAKYRVRLRLGQGSDRVSINEGWLV